MPEFSHIAGRYCDKLNRRAARLRTAHHVNLTVVCNSYKSTCPDAEVYIWYGAIVGLIIGLLICCHTIALTAVWRDDAGGKRDPTCSILTSSVISSSFIRPDESAPQLKPSYSLTTASSGPSNRSCTSCNHPFAGV